MSRITRNNIKAINEVQDALAIAHRTANGQILGEPRATELVRRINSAIAQANVAKESLINKAFEDGILTFTEE